MDKFDKKKIQNVLDEVIDLVNGRKLLPMEAVYLAINFLHQLGLSIYDRSYTDLEQIKQDYKTRRTLGGSVVLMSGVLHQMVEQFGRDIESPPNNEDWNHAIPKILHELVGSKSVDINIKEWED